MNKAFFESNKIQIYEMVTHCFYNVEYYRKRWKFKLPDIVNFTYDFFCKNIPILTKEEVFANGRELVADGYIMEDLLKEGTSGTSGMPLSCYKSAKDRVMLSTILWKQRNNAVKGININDKFAHFYAFKKVNDEMVSGTVIEEKNILYLPLINLNEEQLLENWKALEKFQPKWLQGGTTAIYYMAEVKKKYNIATINSIKMIELNGEYTSKEMYEFIKQEFECEIVNHYGCREFWAMAFLCKNNHMHIVNKSVYMEAISNSLSGQKELLVTGLINKSWPLIRYKLDDHVDIDYVKCDSNFGDGFIVDIKYGRTSSYFTLAGGTRMNALAFAVILKNISNTNNPMLPSIRQFQIVKLSDAHILLKLKFDEVVLEKSCVLVKIENELRKVIAASIKIDYEIVDFFVLSKNGKHKEFIDMSEMTNEVL